MKRKIEDNIYLKSHELLNRIVMPPMERGRAYKNGDTPVAIMDAYYRQRARTGLIISEPIYVSDNSRINNHTSYINKKAQIDGWRKINKSVEEISGLSLHVSLMVGVMLILNSIKVSSQQVPQRFR